MRIWNVICLGVGTLGTALCLSLLLATYTNSAMVGQAFRTLIGQQVSKQVGHAVNAFNARFINGQAEGLQGRWSQQAQVLREHIQGELPEQIDQQVARMQDPNCPCRRILNERLSSMERQMDDLPEFVQHRYAATVHGLLRELRLFFGINAASFALVAVAGWLGLSGRLSPATNRWLPRATSCLIFATCLAIWLYLFKQNWLEILLFNRWMGWSYAAALGALFAWLCDLVLNGASITLQALGGASAGGNVAEAFARKEADAAAQSSPPL